MIIKKKKHEGIDLPALGLDREPRIQLSRASIRHPPQLPPSGSAIEGDPNPGFRDWIDFDPAKTLALSTKGFRRERRRKTETQGLRFWPPEGFILKSFEGFEPVWLLRSGREN